MNLEVYAYMTAEIVEPLRQETFVVRVNEMSEVTPENMEPLVIDTVFLNGRPIHTYNDHIQKAFMSTHDLEQYDHKHTAMGTESFITHPTYASFVDEDEISLEGRIVTAQMTVERILEIHHSGNSIFIDDVTLLNVCKLITKVVRDLESAVDVDTAASSRSYIMDFYDAVLANREKALRANIKHKSFSPNTIYDKVASNIKRDKYTQNRRPSIREMRGEK